VKATNLVKQWLDGENAAKNLKLAGIRKKCAKESERPAIFWRFGAEIIRNELTSYTILEIIIKILVKVLHPVSEIASAQWTLVGNAKSLSQYLSALSVSRIGWPEKTGYASAL